VVANFRGNFMLRCEIVQMRCFMAVFDPVAYVRFAETPPSRAYVLYGWPVRLPMKDERMFLDRYGLLQEVMIQVSLKVETNYGR
jgi:hypothetical protein